MGRIRAKFLSSINFFDYHLGIFSNRQIRMRMIRTMWVIVLVIINLSQGALWFQAFERKRAIQFKWQVNIVRKQRGRQSGEEVKVEADLLISMDFIVFSDLGGGGGYIMSSPLTRGGRQWCYLLLAYIVLKEEREDHLCPCSSVEHTYESWILMNTPSIY